jgi:hypothetical protein
MRRFAAKRERAPVEAFLSYINTDQALFLLRKELQRDPSTMHDIQRPCWCFEGLVLQKELRSSLALLVARRYSGLDSAAPAGQSHARCRSLRQVFISGAVLALWLGLQVISLPRTKVIQDPIATFGLPYSVSSLLKSPPSAVNQC